jgi:carbon storage regulator
MLVLSRKVGEQLMIGEDIALRIIRVRRGEVRIGIEAPRAHRVRRGEVAAREAAAEEPPAGAHDDEAQ